MVPRMYEHDIRYVQIVRENVELYDFIKILISEYRNSAMDILLANMDRR
jgi:hypothetical protein